MSQPLHHTTNPEILHTVSLITPKSLHMSQYKILNRIIIHLELQHTKIYPDHMPLSKLSLTKINQIMHQDHGQKLKPKIPGPTHQL